MPEQVILDMTKTYMFEDEEYILTGRTAVRTQSKTELNIRPRRRRSRRNPPNAKPVDLMVEIEPAPRRMFSDERPVGVHAESKWVKYADLYIVYDQLEDNEEASEVIEIADMSELAELKEILDEELNDSIDSCG